MKERKIAVITDSMSAEFYFPIWHKYYSSQFGFGSIHVVTLPGLTESFRNFELASIKEMDDFYDDDLRLQVMIRRVAELLENNDYVVRVDTDEFLVAEPSKYASLADYVQRVEAEYVSARGFDIFQHNTDSSLRLDLPILVTQRRFAFALNAMNKTCVTSIPLVWNRGFHGCSVAPNLDELFLFHLKRADAAQLIKWNDYLAPRISKDEHIRAYYQTPSEKILAFHSQLSKREVDATESSVYCNEFVKQFLADLSCNPKTGVFVAPYNVETKTIIIPDRFRNIF